jgi:probable rRNA maturation factor
LARIQVLNKQRQYKINRKSVESLCSALLQVLGQPDKAVSIVFITPREIRSLNSSYRKRDYATDVLSFSYGPVEVEGVPFLGEIFIAPDVAVKQAARFRTSSERELRKLLVHAILHLMGYDHETDQGQMNRIQGKIFRRKVFLNAAPLLPVKGD